MAPQKRDNAYYLQRIRKARPDLAVEIAAGRITVAEARKTAGLGGARTRLHELRNAWRKASVSEQDEFLRWSGLHRAAPTTTVASASAPATGSAFDADGLLTGWAKLRILEIMARRNMKSGDVCDELGLKRLDPSVMMAVKNNARVKPSTVPLIEAWLTRNASV